MTLSNRQPYKALNAISPKVCANGAIIAMADTNAAVINALENAKAPARLGAI